MTEEVINKEGENGNPFSNPLQLKKQLLIETDGVSINVVKNDCSVLETREICRCILSELGIRV